MSQPVLDLLSLGAECGCAAKLDPALLSGMLRDNPGPQYSRVLVGPDTLDDAGIFAWDDEHCLVQTLDFFPPAARDPYTYGQIAAANALSDVYAMGGKPLTALAIVCFPARRLPMEVFTAISNGAKDKLQEAGCALLGGHSVVDPLLKYGFSITGIVPRDKVTDNAHLQSGDCLVLTKPLGTGLTLMALQAGLASSAQEAEANRSMAALNAEAARIGIKNGVRTATDITGFGLLGHALQLARASKVQIEFHCEALPRLEGVRTFAEMGLCPAALYLNRSYVGDEVFFEAGIPLADQDLCFDPQTSGGLLLACSPERINTLIAELSEAGLTAAQVGHVLNAQTGPTLCVRR